MSHDADITSGLSVSGMDCASCVVHVEKAAKSVAGVNDVSVNLARARAVVRYDSARTSPAEIAAAITSSGYPATPETSDLPQAGHDVHADHARSWLNRAI